jgi:hypothetical protein
MKSSQMLWPSATSATRALVWAAYAATALCVSTEFGADVISAWCLSKFDPVLKRLPGVGGELIPKHLSCQASGRWSIHCRSNVVWHATASE